MLVTLESDKQSTTMPHLYVPEELGKDSIHIIIQDFFCGKSKAIFKGFGVKD